MSLLQHKNVTLCLGTTVQRSATASATSSQVAPPVAFQPHPARLSDGAADKEAARRIIGRQVEYFDNQVRRAPPHFCSRSPPQQAYYKQLKRALHKELLWFQRQVRPSHSSTAHISQRGIRQTDIPFKYCCPA